MAQRPTQQRPTAAPAPRPAAVSGFDKVLAIVALVAVVAAAASTVWCMKMVQDGLPQ